MMQNKDLLQLPNPNDDLVFTSQDSKHLFAKADPPIHFGHWGGCNQFKGKTPSLIRTPLPLVIFSAKSLNLDFLSPKKKPRLASSSPPQKILSRIMLASMIDGLLGFCSFVFFLIIRKDSGFPEERPES
jgi:hypothetical protein